MAGTITWTKGSYEYACGSDFTGIMIFNFVGPSGGKMTAYSCNMNVDLDGEPQAYAPLDKAAKLRPMDGLGDAGYKDADGNTKQKGIYDIAKAELADLEKKKADLIAKATAPATAPGTSPPPVPTTPAATAPAAKHVASPEIIKLDEQITKKRKRVRELGFDHLDGNGNVVASNPKNFEKIYWKWYGVASMTPEDAKKARPYLEMTADKMTLRRPIIDPTAAYEDVFGRFPIVQSQFEPGPDYFVSVLPHYANTKYPSWDQRYYLPEHAYSQVPFGALSNYLRDDDTKLALGDALFAMRLDTRDTLGFSFSDVGFDKKLAECSFTAFRSLGGEYFPERSGAAKYPNNFLLLYLAFPKKKSPAEILNEYAGATNADEFPVMLSFIAQATADAQAARSKKITAEPMVNFQNWKKAAVKTRPAMMDVVENGLEEAKSNFVAHMARKHQSILGSGPFLTPPTVD